MTHSNLNTNKCCSLLRVAALVIIIGIFDFYVISHTFTALEFPTPIIVLGGFIFGFMNGAMLWVVKRLVRNSNINQIEN